VSYYVLMPQESYTIQELADAAGISRRAIRFYVQRSLIAPPTGLGRGPHYDRSHLQQLERIRTLQSAGHSLDAIARILQGQPEPPLPPALPRLDSPARLYSRLRLADGIELHLDTARFNPDPAQLLKLRDAVRDILNPLDR
jgi:DNA-binding transcriptional MerR regulator